MGDKVSFAVPNNDRASTDVRRLPGHLTEVKGSVVQIYAVATQFGVINSKLYAGDLEHYNGSIDIKTDSSVSLHEAARLQITNNGFLKEKCNCTSACTNKNCSYRANNIALPPKSKL